MRFEDAADLWIAAQEIEQPLARGRFVVHHQDLDGLTARASLASSPVTREGQNISTTVPPSSRRRTQGGLPSGCRPAIRSRVTDKSQACRVFQAPSGRQARAIVGYADASLPSTGSAVTLITVPPEARGEMPWRMAFSTSG